MPPPDPARPSILFPAAWVAVMVAAVAVRFAGLFNDLWLDEIWSLVNAEKADSAATVFTTFRHDNNHWLNTLYLYALGSGWPGPVYRLLSFGTGVGTVLLSGLAGRRHGPLAGLLAAGLVGLSYLPAHYASEARGYAPASFFATGCFYLLQQQAVSFRGWRSAAFAAGAVLGILSNLTFLYVYAGLVAWSFAAAGWDRPGRAVARLAALHALPVVAAAVLYKVSVRGMVIGGGVVRPAAEVFGQVVEWAFGAPNAGWSAVAVGAVVAALAGYGIVLSRRGGDREWVFFAVGCGLGPAALWAAGGRADFYPRYFLLAATMLMVLLARALAAMLHRPGAARTAAAVLLLGFVTGNAAHTRDFLRDGRGNYRDALAFCVARTPPGHPVTVGGDQDFRNGVVVDYYARTVPALRPVEYVTQDRWSGSAPVWVLAAVFAPPAPSSEVIAPNRVRYKLAAVFPQAGASGWTWFVYGAAGPAP